MKNGSQSIRPSVERQDFDFWVLNQNPSARGEFPNLRLLITWNRVHQTIRREDTFARTARIE